MLVFQNFDIQIAIIIKLVTPKSINTHLKAKDSPHTTRILNLRLCCDKLGAKIYV